MPQIIGLMLIGAGIYTGVRAILRATDRWAEELRHAKDQRPQQTADTGIEKDLGPLELDPVSGLYKPTNR